MIPIKTVVDKANTKITAGGLTDLEYTQLSSTDVFLDRALPKVVANFASLPSVVNNEGMMYYVTNEAAYYFSNGTYWIKDFSSNTTPVTDLPIYAWGRNGTGQLGDNTTVSKSSPVNVVGFIALTTNWTQVAAGADHSLGITSAGVAYAWGFNTTGCLGDNTTSNRSSPVTVVGGITTWSQVAAGQRFSLGRTSAGVLYAWGSADQGRLGDNTVVSKSSPVTVVGGITNWSQIDAGHQHSLGVTSTGIAYAWGHNGYGRLGDNSTNSRSSPVIVVGGITTWIQVTAAQYHNIGVTSTGIAYAWGGGYRGKLGDDTIVNKSSPVTVVGGITTWSQASAGGGHSLGVTSTGIAYAWGHNGYGRLGDNTLVSKSSPVTVVGGITNWNKISAGGEHSLGLTSSGILYSWGRNVYGILGDNTIVEKSSPGTVVGGITTWTAIAASDSSFHNLGIFTRTVVTKGFV